jgi:hypothetical protein
MHELTKLVENSVEKHNGLLYQMWMDEKESNILICFGPAPSAHKDNPTRAVKLAFELNNLLILLYSSFRCFSFCFVLN